MSAVKTYLEEAHDLVTNHSDWSIESLTSQFCKDMRCDQGTAVYFLEKAIEDTLQEPVYDNFEDDYDGI